MVLNASASTSVVISHMTSQRLRALRSIATASSMLVGRNAVSIPAVVGIGDAHSGAQRMEEEAIEIVLQRLVVSVE